MNDKWSRWATMTKTKNEKYEEEKVRPVETAVQAKTDKKKKGT